MGRQTSNTFLQLRDKIDSNDPFMSWGHQIARTRTKKKDVPTWVDRPSEIRRILLRSFPKLETDMVQRERAARWARIIQLYFKMGLSRKHVSEELGQTSDEGVVTPMPQKQLNCLIQYIKRAGSGQRCDNTAKLGRPRGRPRNKS